MERRKIVKGQVDDLVLLDDVSEAAIVSNLKATSKDDRIYTWIGPVLVSVNPFRSIPGLYTPELIRKYRNRYPWELAPHVFAVAEDTYRALMNSHLDQCILITGESGAGKTEAAKKVMEYVAAVSPMAAQSDINIKDRLLQSNPVLEAFGNAKTIRNNNSSRFGKYMELVMDFHGRPVGGRITNYLLEKSRVSTPAAEERSFHVFYFLLSESASSDDAEIRALGEPDKFSSLKQSGCYQVPGMSDKDEYLSMRSAMALVGFSEE
jgi:myosin-1